MPSRRFPSERARRFEFRKVADTLARTEAFNPILQDTKKGKLRFVRNCFPHHGYIWN
jgi:hypothetical protein